MSSVRPLRLGTRASPLARWQADWVAARLAERDVEVEMVLLTTRGDREQRGPIGGMGGQGVFTKELQRALLAGEIDLAVHSLKDLPTDAVEGLMLTAVPPRGPAGDVLVSGKASSWEALPQGAVVGTGSLRRRTQLWHARPDLKMQDVRGNIDTRLRKLAEGQYDALILAEAGLERLGLAGEITQVLPKTLMLPAVGQGALGLETRSDDSPTRSALVPLDDRETHAALLAERALLATLLGGCLAPVGAWGRVEGDLLRLSAVVLSQDGVQRIAAEVAGDLAAAAELGQSAAAELLSRGAAELIAGARQRAPGLSPPASPPSDIA
ncbi:MAG TPA: hydroxymethylbilane synthase [Pirellulales bacterium]|nr:hydroxymethylbilane synthase [Pirellulales bacterium]